MDSIRGIECFIYHLNMKPENHVKLIILYLDQYFENLIFILLLWADHQPALCSIDKSPQYTSKAL